MIRDNIHGFIFNNSKSLFIIFNNSKSLLYSITVNHYLLYSVTVNHYLLFPCRDASSWRKHEQSSGPAPDFRCTSSQTLPKRQLLFTSPSALRMQTVNIPRSQAVFPQSHIQSLLFYKFLQVFTGTSQLSTCNMSHLCKLGEQQCS